MHGTTIEFYYIATHAQYEYKIHDIVVQMLNELAIRLITISVKLV